MVEIDALYEDNLHCRVMHGPSGQALPTDAPKDNQGEGKSFSPTDLVGAALGSCILTTMGIVAKRHQLELSGTRAHVVKEMTEGSPRRIRRLAVTVTFARAFDEAQRGLLERTAHACPVHHALHPDIESPIEFVYPA